VNISRKGNDGIGWIADHKDERVLKFSLKDGKILAVWGKQGWGPGEFDWVHGIVVDSKGAVYAADTYGQRLQKFAPRPPSVALTAQRTQRETKDTKTGRVFPLNPRKNPNQKRRV
jgi:hypothetical protein